MRQRLVEAAAALVAALGPSALSARKVANEAGTSTMAVYTHFGSMEALVRAVTTEGFERLEARFLAAEESDDPLRDVAALTAAYVGHARENLELYQVMFVTMPLGKYRPVSAEDAVVGRRGTLDRVATNLNRAIAAGRLRDAGGSALSFRWWAIVHGYVMLEAGGYVDPGRGVERVLAPLLTDLFVGEGDDPRAAADSVAAGLAQRS